MEMPNMLSGRVACCGPMIWGRRHGDSDTAPMLRDIVRSVCKLAFRVAVSFSSRSQDYKGRSVQHGNATLTEAYAVGVDCQTAFSTIPGPYRELMCNYKTENRIKKKGVQMLG